MLARLEDRFGVPIPIRAVALAQCQIRLMLWSERVSLMLLESLPEQIVLSSWLLFVGDDFGNVRGLHPQCAEAANQLHDGQIG